MVKSRSPGPAIYKLPPTIGFNQHDGSKYRNPQYSMSPRLGGGFGRPTIGPGPSYQVCGFTEHGKVTPPAYTLVARYKPIPPFNGPGPGSYSPEAVPRMSEKRPPVYSMSIRSNVNPQTIGPGPLAYGLGSMLGPKVPNKHVDGAYTMSPRYDFVSKSIGPGPAGYGGTNTNIYKYKPAVYTCSPRWMGASGSCSPGPAAYSLKWVPGKTMPKYSMGRVFLDCTPYITPQDMLACKEK